MKKLKFSKKIEKFIDIDQLPKFQNIPTSRLLYSELQKYLEELESILKSPFITEKCLQSLELEKKKILQEQENRKKNFLNMVNAIETVLNKTELLPSKKMELCRELSTPPSSMTATQYFPIDDFQEKYSTLSNKLKSLEESTQKSYQEEEEQLVFLTEEDILQIKKEEKKEKEKEKAEKEKLKKDEILKKIHTEIVQKSLEKELKKIEEPFNKYYKILSYEELENLEVDKKISELGEISDKSIHLESIQRSVKKLFKKCNEIKQEQKIRKETLEILFTKYTKKLEEALVLIKNQEGLIENSNIISLDMLSQKTQRIYTSCSFLAPNKHFSDKDYLELSKPAKELYDQLSIKVNEQQAQIQIKREQIFEEQKKLLDNNKGDNLPPPPEKLPKIEKVLENTFPKEENKTITKEEKKNPSENNNWKYLLQILTFLNPLTCISCIFLQPENEKTSTKNQYGLFNNKKSTNTKNQLSDSCYHRYHP